MTAAISSQRGSATVVRRFLWLEEGHLFPQLEISLEYATSRTGGPIRVGEIATEVGDIAGAVIRSCGAPNAPSDPPTVDQLYVTSEWHATLRGLIASLGCTVVNRLIPELWPRRGWHRSTFRNTSTRTSSRAR